MKMWLKKVLRRLKGDENESLIQINISRSSLLHNLNEFRKLAPNGNIAPVLKSNAYGHGLTLIANELKKERLPFFIIDSYFEAKSLRNEGMKTPLLVIGYSATNTIIKNSLKDISFTITSLSALEDLNSKISKSTNIHLKIDTGMHRQGLLIEEIDKAFEIMKKNKYINLEGISSHLSDADGFDDSFTKKQIEIWNNTVEKTKKEFPQTKYFHLSNTFGHKFAKDIKANISRLGIGLYGLALIQDLNLKPVLEMKTIITGIKKIKKEEFVGYNNTFIADRDMTIATIPVGYFEGLNRKLSNKGFIKIKGQFCPIIGRVSMNITTIDISSIENLKIGDEVNVISSNFQDKNSILYISKISETIPYEEVVQIPEKLKRVIVE